MTATGPLWFDVDVMVAAAERLHRTTTPEDLPRLRDLLKDENFFVREAAAWPLSELAGAVALPELFQAYQRGFDEGHDNDGFSAALIELAAADPQGVRMRSAVSMFVALEELKQNDFLLSVIDVVQDTVRTNPQAVFRREL